MTFYSDEYISLSIIYCIKCNNINDNIPFDECSNCSYNNVLNNSSINEDVIYNLEYTNELKHNKVCTKCSKINNTVFKVCSKCRERNIQYKRKMRKDKTRCYDCGKIKDELARIITRCSKCNEKMKQRRKQ